MNAAGAPNDDVSLLLSAMPDSATLEGILRGVFPLNTSIVALSASHDRGNAEAFVLYELVSHAASPWPAGLELYVRPALPSHLPRPYVVIAEALFDVLGIDTLCGAQDYVTGMDPDDPYWSLAFWRGAWYLADDSGLDPAEEPDSPSGTPTVTLYGPMERSRFLKRGYSRSDLRPARELPEGASAEGGGPGE